MKRRWMFGILALLWLGIIFWNSAQDATSSGELSGGLLDFLNLPISEHLLRKAAHFVLFMVFGVLLSGALCGDKMPLGWILLLALMAACADETIQSFSAGRSSELKDVWLDFCGSGIGVGVFAAVRHFAKRKNFH